MKHVGVICEYNPFHQGHAYLLRQLREADTVICLMSGNFTQRGETAILPPVARAAMAVQAGADLVLELPFPFAAASARYFATAGVRGLAALGVDTLAFGSEGGELAPLRAAADRAPEGDFRKTAVNGVENVGDAAAYFTALGEPLASNDILAVEYLRALRVEQLPLIPLAVRRVGAGYRETVWENGEVIADAPLFSDVKYVYNRTNTNGIEYYDECAALYYGHWRGEKAPSKTPHGFSIGECERIVKLRERGMIFQCVPVNALGFGRLAIVGFGGEPFMHYAQLARECAPDKHVICACCANGYEDYLPTDSAFDEGGYEATSTPFTKGLEADCIAAVGELLTRL